MQSLLTEALGSLLRSDTSSTPAEETRAGYRTLKYLGILVSVTLEEVGLPRIFIGKWKNVVENHLGRFGNSLFLCLFVLLLVYQLAHIPQDKPL